MEATRPLDRFGRLFEIVVVRVIQVLLMIMTAIATIILAELVYARLREGLFLRVESTEQLHSNLQRGFGGVLVVLLGLELLDTLNTYFTRHKVRAEVILIVALIAVGRHIIQLDFDHTMPGVLYGLGALMLALAFGLYLVKKAAAEHAPD